MNNNPNIPPPHFSRPYPHYAQNWPLGGLPSYQTAGAGNIGIINNFGNQILISGPQAQPHYPSRNTGNFPILFTPESLCSPNFYPSNINRNISHIPKTIKPQRNDFHTTNENQPKKRKITPPTSFALSDRKIVDENPNLGHLPINPELLNPQLSENSEEQNDLPSIELTPTEGKTLDPLKDLKSIVFINKKEGNNIDFLDFKIELTYKKNSELYPKPELINVYLVNSREDKIQLDNIESKKINDNKLLIQVRKQEYVFPSELEYNKFIECKINFSCLKHLKDKPTAADYFSALLLNSRIIELNITTANNNYSFFIPVYLFSRKSIDSSGSIRKILRNENKKEFLINLSNFKATNDLKDAISSINPFKTFKYKIPPLKTELNLNNPSDNQLKSNLKATIPFPLNVNKNNSLLNVTPNKLTLSPLISEPNDQNVQTQPNIVDSFFDQNLLPIAEQFPVLDKTSQAFEGLQNIILVNDISNIHSNSKEFKVKFNQFKVVVTFPTNIDLDKLPYYRAIAAIINPQTNDELIFSSINICSQYNKLILDIFPGIFNFSCENSKAEFIENNLNGREFYGIKHPQNKSIVELTPVNYKVIFEKFIRIVKVNLFCLKGSSDKFIFSFPTYIFKKQMLSPPRPIGNILENPESKKNFMAVLGQLKANSTLRVEEITIKRFRNFLNT